jgi:ubiquinone/menaquinone biosynthesis C-methylase UbiE
MDIKKILLKNYMMTAKVLVPTLRYSQYLYEDVLNSYVNHERTWLDLGCGRQILPEWRFKEEGDLVNKCRVLVGIDSDFPSLKQNKSLVNKLRGDISNLPFKKDSFNLLTANMVVEHLKTPNVIFKEINRVLKPGGIFIFHTPNALSYLGILGKLIPNILKNKITFFLEGRRKKDVFRTYYKVNTKGNIIRLAKETGFQILKIRMIVTSAQFAVIPPLMLMELIWIKILMTKPLEPLRTNIITVLRKEISY